MWFLSFMFAISISVVSHAKSSDKDCVDWFNRSKIQSGSKDCELRCTTPTPDMGTFMCPNQCEELCKVKPEESLLAKFVLYPGLTSAEKQFVAKYPKQAYIVYQQKGIVEDLTDKNFPDQNHQ